MKKIFLLLAVLLPISAQSKEIRSTKTEINVARIVKVERLSRAEDKVLVNIAIEDLGGSTDLSPTQTVYLTIYNKGEMFSTDASFPLASVLDFKGAKRLADGLYSIKILEMDENGRIQNAVYRINARQALKEIEHVDCGVDFDCDKSTNFSSAIQMVRK